MPNVVLDVEEVVRRRTMVNGVPVFTLADAQGSWVFTSTETGIAHMVAYWSSDGRTLVGRRCYGTMSRGGVLDRLLFAL